MLSNKWTFSLTSFVVANRFRARLLRTFCYGRWGCQEDAF